MVSPKVSVWSQFRDDAGHNLSQYRQRLNALDYPPGLLRFYLGEGDSLDGTWAELCLWSRGDSRIVPLKKDTGQPRLWHTPSPARMKTLALTGNAVWDRIAEEAWGDYALMLESDLLYTPDLLSRLISRLPEDAAALAPMIWLGDGAGLRFYDVWAFRIAGEMFPPASPVWYGAQFGEEPLRIDSAGSVVLFKMSYIKEGARLSEESAVVGMCEQIRQMGGLIYCDPETHVIHPPIKGAK